MECPKCHSEMETFRYGAGDREVQRCTGCYGIWFKPIDMRRLRNTYMADVIDEGNRRTGRKHNKIEDIDCPICGKQMDKVNDDQQKHIWYEKCPDDHGIYLDAGELTDYSNETMMDYVKTWITGGRKGD